MGGTVIEMEHQGDRIVLEAGQPLSDVPFRDLLPDVPGLWSEGDGSLKGLFITHGHPDHYGLADLADPVLPIFMGRGAKDVIDAAAFFTDRAPHFDVDRPLEDGEPIHAGAFKVTPFLVDHSGFDAYGLLVEADDRSLFYTGDIRFHGRKSQRMRQLARRLPDGLDCLVTEGTALGRPVVSDAIASENALETHLAECFRQTEGAALAFYSAQNIDRLVTTYRASRRAGRTLVLDLYGATVAAATGRDTIPQAGWDGLQVCLRDAERIKVKESNEFERVRELGTSRIYPEEVAADPSRYVITARKSSINRLNRAGCLSGARGFWMQWAGYLEADRRLIHQLRRIDVPIELTHVSGHSTQSDLLEFVQDIAATNTVPVHSASPELLADQLPNIALVADGEWWSLGAASKRTACTRMKWKSSVER